MHFTIDQEDATTVFRLKEERLDSQNASPLKAEFLILAQSDIETLIIDLSEVSYVDSAGLSALLLAERQMASHGGDVRLVGLNESVAGLLRLTQLDRVFPIFETVDQALDAEPALDDDDEDEETPIAPGAPSVSQIKAGAIAAGGSLGAAALAKIMMTPYDDFLGDLDPTDPLAPIGGAPFSMGFNPTLGDEDDFDDDDEDDDDDLDEVDDLDEEDDVEDEDEDYDDEDVEEDDIDDEELLDDDEFEDDDFDEEELEEDEEEDY